MPCMNCAYWTASPRDDWELKKGWGKCKRSEYRDGGPIQEDTPMFASDASAYLAILNTAPTFHCSEFKDGPGP